MAVIAYITLEPGTRPLVRRTHRGDHRHVAHGRPGLCAGAQPHARLSISSPSPESSTASTPDIDANASAIAAYLSNQARLRGLSTIQLIRRDRSVIVEGETSSNLECRRRRKTSSAKLDAGQPALIAPGTTNLVGGVIKLADFDDVYLYLARPIDPRVTRYLRLTEENAAEYEQLQANRFGVQIAFAILFVGMALVVLLSAIWIGLDFARSLVSPIRRLIGAAEEVVGRQSRRARAGAAARTAT